jgi:nitroreductase
MPDVLACLETLLTKRQTFLPKRLHAPGPDTVQLHQILAAAAHAPDHDQILPWRFIIIPDAMRATLGTAFAQALLERDATASPEQVEQAREKAFRSPLLMLLVVDAQRGDPAVDMAERLVSAGCAVQNMLLMATGMGFGSSLTSGKALKATGLRQLFGLQLQDQAICFINMGTVERSKPPRVRPRPGDYVCQLSGVGTITGYA